MLGTKKLLLRAFWEKVPTLRDFETLRGVHCEFLNISDRIENRLKLQVGNPYFSPLFIDVQAARGLPN
jgi:hypothetical protein